MSETRLKPKQPYVQEETLILERMVVELECYAKKLRKALIEEGRDITFAKTLLLFWYAPTKQQFQCHILGRLVSGKSLTHVCIAAQEEFVRIYNECFGTEVEAIWDCTFDFNPENWSKLKLVKEYKRLSELVEQRNKGSVQTAEKRGVGRPKKVRPQDEDAIRLCADNQKKEKKHKHHKEKLSRYEQVEEYLGKKADESKGLVRQDKGNVEHADSEISD